MNEGVHMCIRTISWAPRPKHGFASCNFFWSFDYHRVMMSGSTHNKYFWKNFPCIVFTLVRIQLNLMQKVGAFGTQSIVEQENILWYLTIHLWGRLFMVIAICCSWVCILVGQPLPCHPAMPVRLVANGLPVRCIFTVNGIIPIGLNQCG